MHVLAIDDMREADLRLGPSALRRAIPGGDDPRLIAGQGA